MVKSVAAALAFIGAVVTAPVQAAIIVDTGPQTTGAPSFGGSRGAIAGLFTITQSYRLSSIQYFGGGVGRLTIAIRQGGATPGALIYSKDFNGVPGRDWRGVDNLSWLLGAGSYYVTVENDDGDRSAISWGTGFQNPLPNEQVSYRDTWHPSSDTAYSGSPGFGFRINADAVSGVPEPSTWAMLIAGFGAVGGALRSGRRQRDALKLA